MVDTVAWFFRSCLRQAFSCLVDLMDFHCLPTYLEPMIKLSQQEKCKRFGWV